MLSFTFSKFMLFALFLYFFFQSTVVFYANLCKCLSRQSIDRLIFSGVTVSWKSRKDRETLGLLDLDLDLGLGNLRMLCFSSVEII